jgi:hypothetical protein
MNRRQQIQNVLLLKTFLDEFEEKKLEEKEETSNKEEDSIILKATLVQQLTTRYLKS